MHLKERRQVDIFEKRILTAEGSSEKAGGEGVLRREGASFTFITGGTQGGGAGAGGRQSQCWVDERLYVTASQCPHEIHHKAVCQEWTLRTERS